MHEYDLNSLEAYTSDKFSAVRVFECTTGKTILLHILPGQKVPVHPHPRLDVILIPRRGQANVIDEGGVRSSIKEGCVYYCGAAPVFGLENDSDTPFQTLVVLQHLPGSEGS